MSLTCINICLYAKFMKSLLKNENEILDGQHGLIQRICKHIYKFIIVDTIINLIEEGLSVDVLILIS